MTPPTRLLAGALLCLGTSASAQLALEAPSSRLTLCPGATVVFRASVTNNGSEAIVLDGFAFGTESVGLTVADAPLLAQGPLVLTPGQSLDPDLVILAAGADAPPGLHEFCLTLLGGIGAGEGTELYRGFLRVEVVGGAPLITGQPAPAILIPGAPALFELQVQAGSPTSFRWEYLRGSGEWLGLTAGTNAPTTDPDSGRVIVTTGADAAVLIVSSVLVGGVPPAGPSPALIVRAIATNACGTSVSAAAELSGPAPVCSPADIVSIGGFPPADGELTVDDYTSFINAFAGDELLADIVSIGGFPPPDGELTVDDYTSFINAFAEGCPG